MFITIRNPSISVVQSPQPGDDAIGASDPSPLPFNANERSQVTTPRMDVPLSNEPINGNDICSEDLVADSANQVRATSLVEETYEPIKDANGTIA